MVCHIGSGARNINPTNISDPLTFPFPLSEMACKLLDGLPRNLAKIFMLFSG